MADDVGAPRRKLFGGGRLRRLRRSMGLTQTRMAADLGLSPSYLNLIERNQRPLSAAVLLRLADAYDVDVRTLAAGADEDLADRVARLLIGVGSADGPGRQDIHDFAQEHPEIARAVLKLGSLAGGPRPDVRPTLERVRDHLLDRENHFPALDEQAERLADAIRLSASPLDAALRERLHSRHAIAVRVLPADVMGDRIRRLDLHARQLLLSEALDGASRAFQLSVQLAHLEMGDLIAAEVASAAPTLAGDSAAADLLTAHLASYWAAALMMPYARFHAAAEALAYDIEMLQARFSAGFEQVAHRLTTLQRPGLRGVPFLLLRVDRAGQVSKRFAAGRLPFATSGGQCPLWIVHAAFERPGQLLTQTAELDTGERIFTIARTVRPQAAPWGTPRPLFAVALACALDHAAGLVYWRGQDPASALPVPIGARCTECLRAGCRQRSAPPAGVRLSVRGLARGFQPYDFGRPAGEEGPE